MNIMPELRTALIDLLYETRDEELKLMALNALMRSWNLSLRFLASR